MRTNYGGKAVGTARNYCSTPRKAINPEALVPHNLATFLSSQTKMLLMSLGSGNGCNTQFLFSDDFLGDYEERLPRHAKAYRNFVEEHRRLQRERVAAFGEYIADVKAGRFPARSNLVEMDGKLLKKVIRSTGEERR